MIAWLILVVVAVLFFVVGIFRPTWFSKNIPLIKRRLYNVYNHNLIILKNKQTFTQSGYNKVKGTPINSSRRNNGSNNFNSDVEDNEIGSYEIETSAVDEECDPINYTYGAGTVSPDTIIIEQPPSSISSIKSQESDVPSPSLHSLPSIVSVLQAKGSERLNLLDTRRRRLRKTKS